MVEITAMGKEILQEGKVELKVKRQGIRQDVEFEVRRVPVGRATAPALVTSKIIDMHEMERIAAETGLPVFAANGKVFPKGTGLSDFIGF